MSVRARCSVRAAYPRCFELGVPEVRVKMQCRQQEQEQEQEQKETSTYLDASCTQVSTPARVAAPAPGPAQPPRGMASEHDPTPGVAAAHVLFPCFQVGGALKAPGIPRLPKVRALFSPTDGLTHARTTRGTGCRSLCPTPISRASLLACACCGPARCGMSSWWTRACF